MRYVILRNGREIPVELAPRNGGYVITLDGKTWEVDSEFLLPGLYSLLVDGKSYEVSVYSPEPDVYNVHLYDGTRRVELLSPIGLVLRGQSGGGAGHGAAVKAPMPGKVVKILVEPGQAVRKGQGVIVVEAMKMQNELQALTDGIVRDIRVKEGEGVVGGADLVVIAPAEEA
ncbi:MAG: biotin/lipoyl-containing protein [Acidobacteriota bacterium]